MKSRNIAILFILSAFLVISYFLINKYLPINETVKKGEEGATPTVVEKESFKIPSDWQEYRGETVSFYHPPSWKIEEVEPFGGAVIESIELNVPDSFESNIFYSASAFDLIKPETILREQGILINDKNWTEWVREESGNISYDFYVNEISIDAGSFVVHAKIGKLNDEFEEEVVNFIKTIKFEKIATEEAQIE